MSNILSLSLGTIHKLMKDENGNRDELVSIIKNSNIKCIRGVEITYTDNLKLSEENISYLQSLDYVSIHAPEFEEDNKIILDKINVMYYKVNAKTIVFHPNYMPSTNILNEYKFNISIENLDPVTNFDIYNLEKKVNESTAFNVCLDVNHAYRCSSLETTRIITKMKDKIFQIHLSFPTHNQEGHGSLKLATKEFIESIYSIKSLNVPIVIEEDLSSIEEVRKEINYIEKII